MYIWIPHVEEAMWYLSFSVEPVSLSVKPLLQTHSSVLLAEGIPLCVYATVSFLSIHRQLTLGLFPCLGCCW